MNVEVETPSLEEVSDAELEKQIESSSAITLSEDGHHSSDEESAADDSSMATAGARDEGGDDSSIGDSKSYASSDTEDDDATLDTPAADESEVDSEEEASPEIEDSKGGGTPPGSEWFTPEDEGDETDTDDDEEFFQKLEADINTDHLVIYHPELMQNNYQEIKAFCKVVRNKKGIIIDPLHTTIPFLTKYERARVLGVRCKQLNNDADAFVTVPPNIISGMLIAEEELKQKKIPFIIRRPLPNGGSEYWRLEDLEIIEY